VAPYGVAKVAVRRPVSPQVGALEGHSTDHGQVMVDSHEYVEARCTDVATAMAVLRAAQQRAVLEAAKRAWQEIIQRELGGEP